ncbi:unnamed protein product [Pedinophyceae sp. YPF-701]|nr:unnamed protein product [Pedinophyceae sp. YPF-701]
MPCEMRGVRADSGMSTSRGGVICACDVAPWTRPRRAGWTFHTPRLARGSVRGCDPAISGTVPRRAGRDILGFPTEIPDTFCCAWKHSNREVRDGHTGRSKMVHVHIRLGEPMPVDADNPDAITSLKFSGVSAAHRLEQHDDILQHLTDIIAWAQGMTELEVSDIALDAQEDAAAFANALCGATHLKQLRLRNCSLSDAGMHLVAGAFLSMVEIPQLRVLVLRGNNLGYQGALATAKLIAAAGQGLEMLDLSFNGVGDAGATLLGAALATGTSLQHLDLDGNPIGDIGYRAIANSLTSHHNTLRELGLSAADDHAGVTDTGASAIARALGAAKGLHVLRLDGHSNLVQQLGFPIRKWFPGKQPPLMDALANSSLRVLSMRSCGFSGPAVNWLADMISKNPSIQTLRLEGNRIGPRGRAAIDRARRRRNTTCDVQIAGTDPSRRTAMQAAHKGPDRRGAAIAIAVLFAFGVGYQRGRRAAARRNATR